MDVYYIYMDMYGSMVYLGLVSVQDLWVGLGL